MSRSTRLATLFLFVTLALGTGVVVAHSAAALTPADVAQTVVGEFAPGSPEPTPTPGGSFVVLPDAVKTTRSFVTLPDDFPAVTVTLPASGTAGGLIFLAPMAALPSRPPGYLLILDNAGQPVYYRRLPDWADDFKQQPNGLLTYWTGGTFYALDNSYRVVHTYRAGHGHTADNHDLQVLPNGHALLMAYDPRTVDMSQIVPGGYPTATVIGLIIQEIDTAGNVVFEWQSWDHFRITDSIVSLTAPVIDYVHGNAIARDWDGNLLLSSRHLDEITKIDRQSGDIIWRLGGKNNQFAIAAVAPLFRLPHDIRRLPNRDVTLFDNRVGLQPAYARALEIRLDEANRRVDLVWQYQGPSAIAMGNMQRLPNGNTLIGWGSAPRVTEVRSDGEVAFELNTAPHVSYRAFRFPWHGYPTTRPLLVASVTAYTTTLTYAWNGATEIAAYRVYGGNRPQSTTLLTTQTRTGYETTTVVALSPPACGYFRVMPVDVNGRETVYSNEVTTCARYFPLIGGP